MKHKLYKLTAALLLALLLVGAASAAGGDGTAENPYIIQTPAELQSMQNDLSAYYVLANDIDMSGFDFVPIGSSDNLATTAFHGSLDGNGHTIHNLNIDLPSTPYVGLFAVITAGTTIKNLKFADCTISGAAHTGTLYGCCIGISGVTTPFDIDNIDVERCTVTSSGNNVGGIAGSDIFAAVGTLSNCNVVSCAVFSTSSYHVGGIVGYLANAQATNVTVRDCLVDDCHIISGGPYIGGIAGYLANAQAQGYAIKNTVRDCVIESTSSNVGGIASYLSDSQAQGYANENIVENCVITGGNNVGGIVGYLSGGLSQGYVNENIVENCTVRAGNYYAGGIAGCKYAAGFGNLSGNSVSSTTILASSYAGGICSTFER